MQHKAELKRCMPILGMLLLLAGLPAHATIINPLLGLDIGGVKYDVTFHTGVSFADLWDSDNDKIFGNDASLYNRAPTFWGDFAGADLARDEVIAAFGTTHGWSAASDAFSVPIAFKFPNEVGYSGDIAFDYTQDAPVGFAQNFDWEDTQNLNPLFSWAAFEPKSVPTPPSLLLILAGVLALLRFRGRVSDFR